MLFVGAVIEKVETTNQGTQTRCCCCINANDSCKRMRDQCIHGASIHPVSPKQKRNSLIQELHSIGMGIGIGIAITNTNTHRCLCIARFKSSRWSGTGSVERQTHALNQSINHAYIPHKNKQAEILFLYSTAQ